MKKQTKKINKKIDQNKYHKRPFQNKKKFTKSQRKQNINKLINSNNQPQKQQSLMTKQKPLIFSYKSKKVIGTKIKQKFSLKVERSYGQKYVIKNKQVAKQKVKQEMRSLDEIINNYQQKGSFFRDLQMWIINDEYLKDQVGQLDFNQIGNIRKVMFHMFEGTFTYLSLETKMFSSLIMFSHVRLQNLREIVLKNTVISIQSLVWMDCPSLRTLTIQQSDVVNIKSLNKCNWKDLSFLRIMENKIPWANFQRIRMKKGSTLQVIRQIQPYQYRNTHLINETISVQDVRNLARSQVQSTALAKKHVLCNNRISQLKIIQKFISRSIIEWGNEMQDQSEEDFQWQDR